MKKVRAIELLGGSIPAAASALGVSYQAVNQWPDELPRRIEDRVVAALARKGIPLPDDLRDPTPTPTPAGEASHA